jgi:hypothetical protein
MSYKHVDYAITFESHNIDDSPLTPPHAEGGMGWGGAMDIAIGVINVMNYFECYGTVNMLVLTTCESMFDHLGSRSRLLEC